MKGDPVTAEPTATAREEAVRNPGEQLGGESAELERFLRVGRTSLIWVLVHGRSLDGDRQRALRQPRPGPAVAGRNRLRLVHRAADHGRHHRRARQPGRPRVRPDPNQPPDRRRHRAGRHGHRRRGHARQAHAASVPAALAAGYDRAFTLAAFTLLAGAALAGLLPKTTNTRPGRGTRRLRPVRCRLIVLVTGGCDERLQAGVVAL